MQITGSKANLIFNTASSLALLNKKLIAYNHSIASPKHDRRSKTKKNDTHVERNLEDALDSFDRMLRMHQIPSVVVFNQLLGVCVVSGSWKDWYICDWEQKKDLIWFTLHRKISFRYLSCGAWPEDIEQTRSQDED